MPNTLDTGASKSFLSKIHYLRCKSLHSLPKVASKTQRIQVGNGQYVSVLFIITIITDAHGHRLEYFLLVSKFMLSHFLALSCFSDYLLTLLSLMLLCDA